MTQVLVTIAKLSSIGDTVDIIVHHVRLICARIAVMEELNQHNRLHHFNKWHHQLTHLAKWEHHQPTHQVKCRWEDHQLTHQVRCRWEDHQPTHQVRCRWVDHQFTYHHNSSINNSNEKKNDLEDQSLTGRKILTNFKRV